MEIPDEVTFHSFHLLSETEFVLSLDEYSSNELSEDPEPVLKAYRMNPRDVAAGGDVLATHIATFGLPQSKTGPMQWDPLRKRHSIGILSSPTSSRHMSAEAQRQIPYFAAPDDFILVIPVAIADGDFSQTTGHFVTHAKTLLSCLPPTHAHKSGPAPRYCDPRTGQCRCAEANRQPAVNIPWEEWGTTGRSIHAFVNCARRLR